MTRHPFKQSLRDLRRALKIYLDGYQQFLFDNERVAFRLANVHALIAETLDELGNLSGESQAGGAQNPQPHPAPRLVPFEQVSQEPAALPPLAEELRVGRPASHQRFGRPFGRTPR